MPDYRCYFFDHVRNVRRAEVQEFDGDNAATQWARQLAQAFPLFPVIEVWTGSRLVGRFGPGLAAAAPSARDAGPDMPAIADSPGYWTRQAKEARRVAESMAEPNAKATMLRIAERYESLARQQGA
jgi:hypothetical protein